MEETESKSSNLLLFREVRTELQKIKVPLETSGFRWILTKDCPSRLLVNSSRETKVHNAELFVVCHVNCMALITCLEPLCTIQYQKKTKVGGNSVTAIKVGHN